jgi:hypothetical protein
MSIATGKIETIQEGILKREAILSVYVTALKSWMDKAGELAVSSNNPDKLGDLKNRLILIQKSISENDHRNIGEILEADRIVDSARDLLLIEPKVFKASKGEYLDRVKKRAKALELYIDDRNRRLGFTLNEDQTKFQITKESQIRDIYSGIMNSLVNCNRKDMCSCLANEAAVIGRSLSKVGFLATKSVLDSQCRQIIRQAINKSRMLS